jgi:hypothetical protein
MLQIIYGSHTQHAQVLLGQDRTQMERDGGIARNIQGSAAVNGGPQFAKEGYTGGTSLYMRTHLIAGRRLEMAVHILREIGK